MEKKRKGCIYWLIVGGVTLMFIYSIFEIVYVNLHIRSSKKYAVGITEGVREGAQQANSTKYRYRVGSKIYLSIGPYNAELGEKINVDGGKYYVAYSVTSPRVSLILFHRSLPDSVDIDTYIDEEVEELNFEDYIKANGTWIYEKVYN